MHATLMVLMYIKLVIPAMCSGFAIAAFQLNDRSAKPSALNMYILVTADNKVNVTIGVGRLMFLIRHRYFTEALFLRTADIQKNMFAS
jgi:hypothetical protein